MEAAVDGMVLPTSLVSRTDGLTLWAAVFSESAMLMGRSDCWVGSLIGLIMWLCVRMRMRVGILVLVFGVLVVYEQSQEGSIEGGGGLKKGRRKVKREEEVK